jgi:hypothetical protein
MLEIKDEIRFAQNDFTNFFEIINISNDDDAIIIISK